MQLLNLRPLLLLKTGLVVGLGNSAKVSQVGSSVASTVILSCELQCGLLVCSVCISACGKLAVYGSAMCVIVSFPHVYVYMGTLSIQKEGNVTIWLCNTA